MSFPLPNCIVTTASQLVLPPTLPQAVTERKFYLTFRDFDDEDEDEFTVDHFYGVDFDDFEHEDEKEFHYEDDEDEDWDDEDFDDEDDV